MADYLDRHIASEQIGHIHAICPTASTMAWPKYIDIV